MPPLTYPKTSPLISQCAQIDVGNSNSHDLFSCFLLCIEPAELKAGGGERLEPLRCLFNVNQIFQVFLRKMQLLFHFLRISVGN